MAKITLLPELNSDLIDASETMVVVKNGNTFQTNVSAVTANLAALHEQAIGRAALYGIDDLILARRFVGESLELDFTEASYRDGFRPLAFDGETSSIDISGWTFTRDTPAWAVPDGGTVSMFGANEPRITNRGLLIESAIVQSSLYSSDYANWSVTNLTFTEEEGDPAGQPAKRVQVAANGPATLRANGSGVASATGNTAWVIVKRGSGDTDGNGFGVYNSTSGTLLLGIRFNYKTGEIVYFEGDSGARATELGAGWWLLELTVMDGVALGDGLFFFTGFIGDEQVAGSYFYLAHAQVETSPFATSRVVTNSGLAENRGADTARFEFVANGNFTLFAEVSLGSHRIEETIFSIDDGTPENSIDLYRTAAGAIIMKVTRAGAVGSQLVAVKPSDRRLKVALVSRSNDVRVAVDGAPPVALLATRPLDLARLWLGQQADGSHLNGEVRRLLALRRAATDSEARAMTVNDVRPIAEAPRTGHPLQSRFNPVTAGTPDQVYGRQPVVVYGELPGALLIAENSGPSALAIGSDGKLLFRDPTHRGRCIDVDPLTGRCLVTPGESYRTIAWLDVYGYHLRTWSLPGTVTGEIYGFRTNGQKLVINTITGADGETWIFDLDAEGVPVDGGAQFPAFSGAGKQARGMDLDPANNLLWVASIFEPGNPQGCRGALQAYSLADGSLVHDCYGHYPNDVDLSPTGTRLWVDEHLDRVRELDLSTGTVRTVMAGLKICADYEPAVSSISANVLARVVAGSTIEAAAVEYRFNGIYSPNGISILADGLFALADTDNGRVVIVRVTETWEPEIVAVIAHLNEPTKVRRIPDIGVPVPASPPLL